MMYRFAALAVLTWLIAAAPSAAHWPSECYAGSDTVLNVAKEKAELFLQIEDDILAGRFEDTADIERFVHKTIDYFDLDRQFMVDLTEWLNCLSER